LLLLLLLLRYSLLLMAEKRVLFLCVENSCRSLMAEAIFNADPPEGWRAISAGTSPGRDANPRTGPMLQELGVSLPAHPPQGLTPEMIDVARVRVSMGCLDDASCPARLGTLELRDWNLEDPAKLDDAGFRRVRDRLAGLVRDLRTELIFVDRTTADLTAGRAR
jgi:arsenate reductase (thioredoxin)